jgi:hypothetical protein
LPFHCTRDPTIAKGLAPTKRAATTVLSLEAHQERIAAWLSQSVSGVVMHTVLKREHGYTGSYSALRRMLGPRRRAIPPQTTVRLSFAPGEAAQVDFGTGPILGHPSGGARRNWAFVMTLCFSRHQCVEFVWGQTVATWLGCHRRAFEWFAAVPARLIIDNAKCADGSQAKAWVMDEAGTRRHGTTGEALTRFALERALLLPLRVAELGEALALAGADKSVSVLNRC